MTEYLRYPGRELYLKFYVAQMIQPSNVMFYIKKCIVRLTKKSHHRKNAFRDSNHGFHEKSTVLKQAHKNVMLKKTSGKAEQITKNHKKQQVVEIDLFLL